MVRQIGNVLVFGLAMLLLSSCAGAVKEISSFKIEKKREPLAIEDPAPLELQDIDWIIITSYKSWELLIKQLDNSNMDIPKQTKIAAFGSETARRIVQSGREVNFTKNVKNSKYFASLLAELLEEDSKIAYPASSSAGGQIEEIFSQTNISRHLISDNVIGHPLILTGLTVFRIHFPS